MTRDRGQVVASRPQRATDAHGIRRFEKPFPLVGELGYGTNAGLDISTAFSAVVACVNNMGPGLNEVGPAANYGVLNDFETWVCTVAMRLGRLELMSVFVLLTPDFSRK